MMALLCSGSGSGFGSELVCTRWPARERVREGGREGGAYRGHGGRLFDQLHHEQAPLRRRHLPTEAPGGDGLVRVGVPGCEPSTGVMIFSSGGAHTHL